MTRGTADGSGLAIGGDALHGNAGLRAQQFQGALLLFKINTSVYDNRPLTLQIRGGQSQKVWGSIALDL